jgi:UDP-glucose 4-epimerase
VTSVYDVAVAGSSGFLGSAIAAGMEARGASVARYTVETPMLRDGVVDEGAARARTLVWAASRVNPVLAVERPDLVLAEKADLAEALRALVALPHPPRVVFLSSGGTVYGPPERAPFSESCATHPVNAYGALKRELERGLFDSGLDAVAARVSNAYGPGQVPAPGQGVIAHWLTAASRRAPITVFGDRVSTRDYAFIDDIVEAVARIHDHAPALPSVLNVGSGSPSSLDDVLSAVTAAVGADALDVREAPQRGTDTASTWLDISLAREVLGWEAKVGLGEGVARAWASMQTR